MTSPAETRSQAVSPVFIPRMWTGACFRRVSGKQNLFGAEQAISGVAEAGHDVALFVEVVVDRRGEHRHVGMHAVKRADALGAGQQAHELDRARTALLEAA